MKRNKRYVNVMDSVSSYYVRKESLNISYEDELQVPKG